MTSVCKSCVRIESPLRFRAAAVRFFGSFYGEDESESRSGEEEAFLCSPTDPFVALRTPRDRCHLQLKRSAGIESSR